MSEEQKVRAKQIFSKPSGEWTNDENMFLGGLFRLGFRKELKELRATLPG